jgi:hypothetical protein
VLFLTADRLDCHRIAKPNLQVADGHAGTRFDPIDPRNDLTQEFKLARIELRFSAQALLQFPRGPFKGTGSHPSRGDPTCEGHYEDHAEQVGDGIGDGDIRSRSRIKPKTEADVIFLRVRAEACFG